jgi:hypothetical protein
VLHCLAVLVLQKMGPKKDAKKKGAKSDGPITVDLADFTREVSDSPVYMYLCQLVILNSGN